MKSEYISVFILSALYPSFGFQCRSSLLEHLRLSYSCIICPYVSFGCCKFYRPTLFTAVSLVDVTKRCFELSAILIPSVPALMSMFFSLYYFLIFYAYTVAYVRCVNFSYTENPCSTWQPRHIEHESTISMTTYISTYETSTSITSASRPYTKMNGEMCQA